MARSGTARTAHGPRSPASDSPTAPMSASTGSAMANTASLRSRWRWRRSRVMLLLDEPMAGMGPEESARMVEMLRGLKGGVTILLIEHDMETVFALADRITVLGLWPYHRLRRSPPSFGRTPPCAKPIWASRKSTRMSDQPLLEVSNIETSYGLSRVLFGISLEHCAGRSGLAAWAATAWERPRPYARSWD